MAYRFSDGEKQKQLKASNWSYSSEQWLYQRNYHKTWADKHPLRGEQEF